MNLPRGQHQTESREDAQQTAVRLLGQVGLADRAQSRIATYSLGMRQRLGIARVQVTDT